MGKWHLDGFDEHTHYVPPERRGGFDYWMGYDNNNNQEECFVFGTGHESPRRLPGYETDSLTDLALSHLREHVNGNGADGSYQPFFAVLSVQPPHGPMVPPTNPGYRSTVPHQSAIAFRPNVPASARFREQVADDAVGYYGMIENLDFNLGRILTELKTMGIDRETYVVFFSDHGDLLGSHGFQGNSLPWEECIRIPFLVGMVGGRFSMKVGRTDALLNHVDIAPTTLGLCGIEVPERMVGHDYSRHCIRRDRPEYRGEPDPGRRARLGLPAAGTAQVLLSGQPGMARRGDARRLEIRVHSAQRLGSCTTPPATPTNRQTWCTGTATRRQRSTATVVSRAGSQTPVTVSRCPISTWKVPPAAGPRLRSLSDSGRLPSRPVGPEAPPQAAVSGR